MFKLFGVPGAVGGLLCAAVAIGAAALAWRVHKMDVKPGEAPTKKKQAVVTGG
jgi:hypothetical protein